MSVWISPHRRDLGGEVGDGLDGVALAWPGSAAERTLSGGHAGRRGSQRTQPGGRADATDCTLRAVDCKPAVAALQHEVCPGTGPRPAEAIRGPCGAGGGKRGSGRDSLIIQAVIDRLATAPIAAGGLIAGYGVAVATGSRPLGGVVLALCGGACIAIWLRRDGRRTTIILTLVGLGAFALSHALGLVIGAWPAVLVVAAVAAAACWRLSDSRRFGLMRTRAA